MIVSSPIIGYLLGIFLYLPNWKIEGVPAAGVGKGQTVGLPLRENEKEGWSKNTEVFGSGNCLSAVVDIELTKDVFQVRTNGMR